MDPLAALTNAVAGGWPGAGLGHQVIDVVRADKAPDGAAGQSEVAHDRADGLAFLPQRSDLVVEVLGPGDQSAVPTVCRSRRERALRVLDRARIRRPAAVRSTICSRTPDHRDLQDPSSKCPRSGATPLGGLIHEYPGAA